MQKNQNSKRAKSDITKTEASLTNGVRLVKHRLFWFSALFLLGTLPALLVLITFGVLYAIQNDWLLILLGLSLATVGLVWAISQIWLSRIQVLDQAEQSKEKDDNKNPQWTDHDAQVWRSQQLIIGDMVHQQPTWAELPEKGIELIQGISQQYNKANEFAFSIPEALRMTEEVSRRYRLLLLEQVPYIEQAKLSYIKAGFENKNSIGTGFKIYKYTYNVYRAFRTVNPLAALVGEVRNMVLNQVGQKLLQETDQLLKTALLEEICKTAIELYSGRFRFDVHQVLPNTEPVDMALELEPIRIAVLGQPSVGKSSLVNALTKNINAEVHPLPSTSGARGYQCQISSDLELNLVDLPGVDGTQKTTNLLLEQLRQSDLVLWVLKANQPARQLDLALKSTLDAYYQASENISKKAPKIIGVLNQADLLLPASERFAFSKLTFNTANEAVLENMPQVVIQAVQYNEDLLKIPVIPTCLVNDPVNLNSVLASIELHYEQALQTQLNKRRHLAGHSASFDTQAERAKNLATALFNRISRKKTSD